MKEQEKHYSLFSNIRYAYRTLFQKCAWMRLGIIGIILTGLGGTVIQTATLPVLVASITERGTVKNYLVAVSFMLLVYVLFQYVSRYIGAWSEFYYENTQNREFLMRLLHKSLTADYENVESPSKQRLLTRATHAVHMYRQGVNQMYSHTPQVIINLLGIILYSLTMTMIDYRILIVIFLMFFVSTFLEAYRRKYISN